MELKMENNKIIRYRKPFRPNVATVITIIIIIYVSLVAWNYFKKEQVTIYEVNETSIADDSTITGFIIRNETVMLAEESGYVNFYHADQSKVGKNEVIYTIDANGSVGELLNDVKTASAASENDIAKMRSVIRDYYKNYNPAAYYQVKEFHYNVENAIFEQSRDNLYSDLKKQMSEKHISDDFKKSRAKNSGIISYSIDGYENQGLNDITEDLFKNSAAVERRQLSSSEKIDRDTPVCKLVTDENWSIVIPVSDGLYKKISDSQSLRITVKKDNISFNAGVSFHENGGARYAVLSSGRYMGRYLNDRFLDIELNLNAASGLKIPNSSLLEKDMTLVPENLTTTGGDGEQTGVIKLIYGDDGSSRKEFTSLADYSLSDGKYCVDQSVLKPGDAVVNPANNEAYTLQDTISVQGVYCVNTGYCQFRKIEKIYENNEYTIISPNTKGGVSNYDHIIVNPGKINENDFVE